MNNYNQQPTTIKEAAIKFDIFVRDGGIGASMFFVLIMLIIVNTHSLHYLFGDSVVNWVFAVVSAIGFSIATTAVIRKPVAKWMKFLFPLFDTLLVFMGFNLLNESIPVHFIMTVLFSLFSGAILIGLGTINYNEHIKETQVTDFNSEIEIAKSEIEKAKVTLSDLTVENFKLKSENIELKSDLSEMKVTQSNYLEEIENNHLLNSKIEAQKVTIDKLESEKSDYINIKSELDKKTKSLESLKSQLDELKEYKEGYFRYHKSRIEKKKPDNRTANEIELLKEFEKLEL